MYVKASASITIVLGLIDLKNGWTPGASEIRSNHVNTFVLTCLKGMVDLNSQQYLRVHCTKYS